MPERVLVRNAGSAKQVRRAAETERQRVEREANELREVLSTVSGKRVLWRVLEMCRFHEISFSPDPYTTAFNEGHRNAGNMIAAMINDADPQAIERMSQDAKQLKARIVEPKPTKDDPLNNDEDDDAN